MAFREATTKEINAFRKGELAKLSAIIGQLGKAETKEDVLSLSQQAQSSLVRIQETTNGRLMEEWLSGEQG